MPTLPDALISIAIGIMGSLVAAVIYAAVALLIGAHRRKSKAKPFEGLYRMRKVPPGSELGPGTVTVRYAGGNWTTSVPVLRVEAKHSDGTIDWKGAVEVLGLSEIARGTYQRQNPGEGGTLELILSTNEEYITEYAIPYDPQYKPFPRILEKIGPLKK